MIWSLIQTLVLLILCCNRVLASQADITLSSFLKTTSLYDPSHVIEVQIQMPDWDILRMQKPKGGHCNFDYIGARYDWFHSERVEIDGIIFEDAGIKKRSFCNSQSEVKPALNIKFDKWNLRNDQKTKKMLEADSLILNNSIQDPTLIRQCLAYKLFRGAGIKSPRCNFAHLTVNGQDLGLYVNIEPIKKDFIKKSFPLPLGNLYEISGEQFDYWATDRIYGHKIGFSSDSSAIDYINLVNAITNDTTLDFSILKNFVNIDQFINYWSMELILIHWDGLTHANNNSYIYFGADGKLSVIPWGTDQILIYWGQNEQNKHYHVNFLADKLFNSPKYREELFQAVRNNLKNVWNENQILLGVEEMVQIVKPFIKDINEFNLCLQTLKANIWNRRAELIKLIPEK